MTHSADLLRDILVRKHKLDATTLTAAGLMLPFCRVAVTGIGVVAFGNNLTSAYENALALDAAISRNSLVGERTSHRR